MRGRTTILLSLATFGLWACVSPTDEDATASRADTSGRVLAITCEGPAPFLHTMVQSHTFAELADSSVPLRAKAGLPFADAVSDDLCKRTTFIPNEGRRVTGGTLGTTAETADGRQLKKYGQGPDGPSFELTSAVVGHVQGG